ncbi:MAG: tetratricopeptide repeat protein [Thermodesulfobacteriota bacterium]
MKCTTAVIVGVAFALSVFPAGASIAGPMEDIQMAFVQGEFEAAFRLARALAETGEPKAQNLLGYMYQSGKGVGQDYIEAMRWYRKAAAQGDSEALNNVGVMFENGQGVELDYGEAVKWYKDAAAHGNPVARNNLGVMFAYGKGVPQDFISAYVWFDLAATSYSEWDMDRREIAVGNRDNAAYRLSPGQLSIAKKLAAEMKRKAER